MKILTSFAFLLFLSVHALAEDTPTAADPWREFVDACKLASDGRKPEAVARICRLLCDPKAQSDEFLHSHAGVVALYLSSAFDEYPEARVALDVFRASLLKHPVAATARLIIEVGHHVGRYESNVEFYETITDPDLRAGLVRFIQEDYWVLKRYNSVLDLWRGSCPIEKYTGMLNTKKRLGIVGGFNEPNSEALIKRALVVDMARLIEAAAALDRSEEFARLLDVTLAFDSSRETCSRLVACVYRSGNAIFLKKIERRVTDLAGGVAR